MRGRLCSTRPPTRQCMLACPPSLSACQVNSSLPQEAHLTRSRVREADRIAAHQSPQSPHPTKSFQARACAPPSLARSCQVRSPFIRAGHSTAGTSPLAPFPSPISSTLLLLQTQVSITQLILIPSSWPTYRGKYLRLLVRPLSKCRIASTNRRTGLAGSHNNFGS